MYGREIEMLQQAGTLDMRNARLEVGNVGNADAGL